MKKMFAALLLAAALLAGAVSGVWAKKVDVGDLSAEIPDSWSAIEETNLITTFFSVQDRYLVSFMIMGGGDPKALAGAGAIWPNDHTYLAEDDDGNRRWGTVMGDRFCEIRVIRPYPGLKNMLAGIDAQGDEELAEIIKVALAPAVIDWLTYKTPSPAKRPVPEAKDIPKDIFPVVPDENTPEWIGSYCNPKGCIEITNMRKGPLGYFLSMHCTVKGKTVGEETTLVDPENGRRSGFAAMLMTLSEDGKTLEVAPADPKAKPDQATAWGNQCAGAYTLKE